MKLSTNDMTPYTREQSREIVAELAKNPNKGRVWEIDALRGFLIMLVVFDHLMYTLDLFRSSYTLDFMLQIGAFAHNYRYDINFLGVLRGGLHDSFVFAFIFISGISSSFSRNNAIRGAKMTAVALALTAFTGVYQSITGDRSIIYFNVLHVLAICILCWALFMYVFDKAKSSWAKHALGIGLVVFMLVIFIIGYYYHFKPFKEENIFKAIFLDGNRSFTPGDYFPLFPALSWFMLGGVVGKVVYKEKHTLLPSVSGRITIPLSKLGQYSLWIYFISQIVMLGGVYVLAILMGVL